VVDSSKFDASKVVVMSKVRVRNMQNKQVIQWTLVSEKEADVKTGKISVSSPIGKGLLGKSVGDVAEIQVPSGTMKFEIVDISI
jgi:transcription elongation factor GreA